MILCHIGHIWFRLCPVLTDYAFALAGADILPAIRTDHDSDSDWVLDLDKERDFADQGPP